MPTFTTVDATWDTGITLDAAELRRADTAMFLGDGTANGVRGGVVRHGDTSLVVTVNGSDQVTVQPGAFVIPAATGLGAYRGSIQTAVGPGAGTALTARNATNPRIDLVVLQVTGTNATLKTIDGTPASSPSAPALPAQHIEIARLNVPATGGGAVTVDSTFRSYATGLGGTLFVETAARLPGSGNQKGQRATALDTGYEHQWDGTAWRVSTSPRGVLGYAQVTANQAGLTGTLADLTGLAVTVTVGASRRIRISCHVRYSASATGAVSVTMNEGATVLGDADTAYPSTSFQQTIDPSVVVVNPSAGNHTYKLQGAVPTSGTLIAAATRPAFILVEDLGAI